MTSYDSNKTSIDSRWLCDIIDMLLNADYTILDEIWRVVGSALTWTSD
jgi:hypothetical protein